MKKLIMVLVLLALVTIPVYGDSCGSGQTPIDHTVYGTELTFFGFVIEDGAMTGLKLYDYDRGLILVFNWYDELTTWDKICWYEFMEYRYNYTTDELTCIDMEGVVEW